MLPVHRHEAGCLLDPAQPCADGGEGGEVEVAAVGDMGVAIQRDVGDGELAGGEVLMGLEMVLHHLQRRIAALHPVLQRVGLQLAAAPDQRQPEIGRADIRLQRMLLEEHPLQRVGAIHAVIGRKRRSLRDVPEDRIGFGEIAAGGQFEQRHLSARILRQEVGRAALPAQDVDLDRIVGHVEQRQRKANLVAVARALHRIELVHSARFDWWKVTRGLLSANAAKQ